MAESDVEDTSAANESVVDEIPIDPKVAAVEAKDEGNRLYKLGQYRAAIAQYSKAIELDRQAAYLGNRAAALIMLCSFSEALEDATAAAKLEPAAKHLLRVAKCYLSLGNYNEAERNYGLVQALEPTNTTAQQELKMLVSLRQLRTSALEAIDSNLLNHALSLLDRALELAPSDDAFKMLKAEVYLKQRHYGEVERIAAGMLRVNQTDSAALCLRGRMLYDQGELERAQDHFARALRADPDHAVSRVGLKRTKQLLQAKEAGNAEFKAGNYAAALERYNQALEVDPTNDPVQSKLYFNRALVFHKLARLPEAIADCTTALRLDETYTKALLKRARLHLEGEQYDAAIADFEAALDKEPQNREIRHELQNAKIELKKSKRVNYYKVLGVDKNSSESEITKAYKKLALQCHPDRFQGAEEKAAAEIKFKQLNEAKNVLIDPVKRQRYDDGADLEEINSGSGGGGHSHGFDQSEMFSQFFGRGGGFAGFGGGGHGGFHFG